MYFVSPHPNQRCLYYKLTGETISDTARYVTIKFPVAWSM